MPLFTLLSARLSHEPASAKTCSLFSAIGYAAAAKTYSSGRISRRPTILLQRVVAVLLLVALLAGFGESRNLLAQNPDSLRQRIGEWRVHPSFSTTIDVAAGADFLAYATRSAVLLRYHDGELRFLDKTNALSQGDPQYLAVNPVRPDELLIAYRDGGIEVLVSEATRHYSRAIPSAQIAGRRGINGVRYLDGDLAVVAADFGFLLYDAARGIFLDDVRLGSGVNDAAILDGDLFLATNAGLRVLRDYRAQSTLRDTSRYENLNDELLGGLRSPCYAVAAFAGRIYAGFNEELYTVRLGDDGDEVGGPFPAGCGRFVDMSVSAAGLVVLASVDPNCGPDQAVYSADATAFTPIDIACVSLATAIAIAPDGRIGTAGAPASGEAGISYLDAPGGTCRNLAVAGPGFQEVFDVAARDGVVAIAAGGITPQEGYLYNREGVSVLRDGRWTTYNRDSRPILVVDDTLGSSPADFITVAIDEAGQVYGGAFYEGLYGFAESGPADDRAFNETNSSLRTHVDDPARVRIGGITLDEDGNLWVSNYGARNGISVRTAAGEWASFDLNACSATRNFRDLVAVQRFDGSRVVFAIETGRGVVALDPGADLLDPSDDRCARISTNNGLSDPDVRSIAVDRQGDVWLGTNNGIAVINGDPFANDFQVFVPIGTATVDSIRGNLFEGTPIQAIAIDGGNRKWFGTPNGLFLIDARDNAQLEAFDANNSPLPDANVKTLAYDGSTGLLWIGGDNGLASLQTNSTTGRPFAHAAEVEIFPQPVRPDYDGPISIRGLGQDSDVKITDAQGRLVYETSAIGGAATWNGLDYTGRRPASGIYFVWATVTPGLGKPATVVGKIALLR